MRKWNKLLALVLAMVMVFGLTATAFADDDKGEDKDSAPVTDTQDETTPEDKDEATEPAEGEEAKDEATEPTEGEENKDDATEPAEGEEAKDEAAEPTEGEEAKDEATEPAEGEEAKDEATEPAEGEDAPEANEPAAVEIDYTGVEDWAKEHVTAIVEKKLMDVDGNGSFNPNANMTRVDLVVALYRHAESPSVEGKESQFEDIADLTEEQQAAIVWAASEKIVNGETETRFNPNGNVERQQIAKILFVYAKAENVEEDKLSAFPDKDDVAEYAVDFLNWLLAKGIMNGDGDKLNPTGTATRQQVATMLNRYIINVLAAAEPAAPAEGEDAPEATEPTEGEETKDEATEPAEGEDAPEPTEGEETKDETTEPAEGEDAPEATEPAEGDKE